MKMKKLLLLLLASTSLCAYGQISNRLLGPQNVIQDVDPDNLIYTLPPNDNRFLPARKSALRFNFNQVRGILDSVGVYSDARYRAITWLPTWTQVTGKPTFATVATSGLYNDLSGRPTLSTVATTGNYSDLTNRPTIPTNNNQLTNGAGYLTAETDPVWSGVAANYRTKAQNDLLYQPVGTYVTSETDPIWTAAAPSYRTKTQNDLLYYPLSGNPSGFLTSFTEVDPTVPAYAKSLNSFTVIKNATDPLYKPIGYTPTSSEIVSGLGFTPYNATNPSNYITASGAPVQSVNGQTGTVTLSIPAAQIQSDWNQATTTALDFIKNKPVIPTNTNQLVNGAGFITGITSAQVTGALGYTPYNGTTNPNGYLSSITSSQINTALGYTPYNGATNPNGYLTGITSGQVTTALGFTPITTAGARTAISLTTNGTNGAATYNNSTGVLNVPNYTPPSRTFNNTATKTLNGSGVQISTTNDAVVSYTVTHTIALTLLLSTGSSQVFLEISPNNSTWTSISQAGYSEALAVAVSVNKTTTSNVQGVIPAGFYVRLRSVVAGGGSATYVSGQEVLF